MNVHESTERLDEVWEKIPGFYQMISSQGNIRGPKSENLKFRIDNGGYYRISLWNRNKKQENMTVHRMVAQCFIPNPDGLPCINHKDGNKLNNRVTNLEWCTHHQNNQHALRLGLMTGPIHPARGEKNGKHKLSLDDVLKIRLLYKNPGWGKRTKYSQSHLAKMFGISKSGIFWVVSGKIWKNINP